MLSLGLHSHERGSSKIKQELNKVLKIVLVHFMSDPLNLWPVMFILNIFISDLCCSQLYTHDSSSLCINIFYKYVYMYAYVCMDALHVTCVCVRACVCEGLRATVLSSDAV